MIEPRLTALMCDGMGWFRAVDFKRALLLYDQIEYLLPRYLTEFEDVDGEKRFVVFPDWVRNCPSFSIVHFDLNAETSSLLLSACKADQATPEFVEVVQSIPPRDQRYSCASPTRMLVSAVGDLSVLRPKTQHVRTASS